MNIGYRTLTLVVDGYQGRHEYLSESETSEAVAAAGQEASETVAVDIDGIDPPAVADRLAAVVDDDQFCETVDEVADRDVNRDIVGESTAVGASTAVAEVLERQVDDSVDALSAAVRTDAAAAFITALQRGLVSTGGDTRSLVDCGRAALQDGAFETAETCFELSRDIAREVDDSAAEAAALIALGDVALRRGHVETADEQYQEGLEIAREIDDSAIKSTALAGLGNSALQRDDLDTAERYHRESLDITRETGNRSTKANSLASLGTVAGSRDEFEMAQQYLEESLDIKRTIGDEVGEATVLASLGTVAVDREAYERAAQCYSDALEGFTATDQPREQVQTLQNLVTVEQERGNSDAAIEHCETGMALLADTDLSGLDEADRWFRTTRAGLTGDPDTVDALYRTALDRIDEGDDPAAFELLGGVWDCRESFDPGTEPHGRCLRGGVGFAAYHLLLDTDSVETTHTQLCAEISTHREALSEPARVLFEFVKSGGADRDTEISVDGTTVDGESIDALERRVYSGFLSRLSETPSPSELYSQALTAIVTGNNTPGEVVQLCLVAWEQRDDVPEDSQAILGSLLLVEAHRECFEFDLPTDRQETFDRIADNRSVLSTPMAGLFDQLATGSTEADADELLAAADRVDPSVLDVERMAAARFLDALVD